MRYEEYRKKTKKKAAVRAVIKRFRVLISICAAVLVLSIGTMLALIGVSYNQDNCPTSIVYGSKLDYSADAIFRSDVSYEYSSVGSDKWTATQPINVGKYRVRSVSKDLFGKPRYGKVHEYSITPKKVNVSAVETTIRYGDMLTAKAKLEYSDVISCDGYAYEDLSQTLTNVVPLKENIKVKNASGADITANYEFNCLSTSIAFTKRVVNVVVDSKTTVYDGKALEFKQYEISDDTPLAWNDSPVAVFTSAVTDVNDGVPNTAEITILNGAKNVSANYTINITPGVLKRTKRSIAFKSHDLSEMYDGQPIICNTFDVLSTDEGTGYAEGHYAVGTGNDALVNVGTAQNTMSFAFFDADGAPVSADNYSVFLEPGTLEVTKRPVQFTAVGAEKMYDGTVLKATEFISSGEYDLVSGHAVTEIAFNGGQTDVGTGVSNIDKNSIRVCAGETAMTDNYDISVGADAAVSVTKRPITIATATSETVYFGGEYFNKDHEVQTNADNLDEEGRPSYALVSGHQTQVDEWATVSVVNDEPTVNELIVSIYSGETPMTDNYQITYAKGTIKLNLREVTVKATDAEYLYNAEAFSCTEWETPDGDLVTGHVLSTIEFEGEIENVGTENVVPLVDTAVIVDADGEPVTSNYRILADETGTVTVTPRYLSYTTGSAEKTYDDEGISVDEFTLNEDSEHDVVSLHEAKISSGLIEFVDVNRDARTGEVIAHKNAFAISVFDKTSGEPVEPDNYVIDVTPGEVLINPHEVNVTTGGGEQVYNGEELSNSDSDYADCVLVEGHVMVQGDGTSVADVNRAVTRSRMARNAEPDYTSWDNHIDFEFTDGVGGRNVTDNYHINYTYGQLTIIPRPLEYTTSGGEWQYDGTEHKNSAFTTTEFENAVGEYESGKYGLVSGHNGAAIQSTGATNVTRDEERAVLSVDNHVTLRITDGDGTDVTGNYDLKCTSYGQLKIRPIELTVISSKQFIYDGEKKTFNEVTGVASDIEPATESGLVGEQFITLETEQPELAENAYVDVKRASNDKNSAEYNTILGYENKIKSAVVWDGNVDVTVNYEITTETGTITIAPRPVGVKTWSTDGIERAHHVYDGEEFSVEGFDVTANAFLTTHVAEGVNYTVATDVKCFERDDEVLPYENRIDDIVVTENGRDVTHNYDVDVEYGEFTVLRRPITVFASESKTYDDVPDAMYNDIQLHDTSEYDLVLDHEITALTKCDNTNNEDAEAANLLAGIDAGVWKNEVNWDSVVIASKEGNKTNNYDVTCEDGEVTIALRTAFITPNGYAWEYDGNTYDFRNMAADPELLPDVVIDQTQNVSNNFVQVEGYDADRIIPVYDADITSHITNVRLEGEGTDRHVVGVDNHFGVQVLSGRDGRDVTNNYGYEDKPADFIYDYDANDGQLIINPRGITVYSSVEVDYDGEKHETASDNFTYLYPVGTLDEDKHLFEVLPEHTLSVLAVGQEYDSFDSANRVRKACVDVRVDGDDNVIGWENEIVRHAVTDMSGNEEVIENEQARLIADNYAVTYEMGEIIINPIPMSYATNSATWVYDGDDHNEMGISAESVIGLLDGDEISVDLMDVPVITDKGNKPNEFPIHILDGDRISKYGAAYGDEVTFNYTVSATYGELYVLPRPVILTNDSAEKIYDATALTAHGLTSALDDDYYAPYNYDGGNDGSEKFDYLREIGYASEGILVDAHAHAYSASYDGEQTDATEIDGGVRGSATIVPGTVEITEDSVPVTENYVIVAYVAGELVVYPRHVNIATEGERFNYDGDIHTNREFTVVPFDEADFSIADSVRLPERADDYGFVRAGGIVHNGIYVSSTEVCDVMRDSEDYSVIIGTPNDMTISVYDLVAADYDKTKNYVITVQERGELFVDPAELTITANDKQWIYDATEVTVEPHEITLSGDGKTVFDNLGHYIFSISFSYEGDRVNVTDEGVTVTPYGATVLNELYEDKTHNYEFTYADGSVEIIAREVEVKFTLTKTYDATALAWFEFEFPFDMGIIKDGVLIEWQESDNLDNRFIDGHGLIVTDFTETLTDVGELDVLSENISFDIIDTNAENYAVTISGKLIVTKRTVTLRTEESLSKCYDGEQFDLTVENIVMVDDPDDEYDGLVDGHTVTAAEFSYDTENRTDAGSFLGWILSAETVIISSGTTPVTDNYDIVLGEPSNMEIDKRIVCLMTGSAEKVYDATPLSNAEITQIAHMDVESYVGEYKPGEISFIPDEADYGMVGEQRFVMYDALVPEIIDAGEIENEIQLDGIVGENGAKTENYLIYWIYGTLTVTPATVTITGEYSFTYEYDGSEVVIPEDFAVAQMQEEINAQLALINKSNVELKLSGVTFVYDDGDRVNVTESGAKATPDQINVTNSIKENFVLSGGEWTITITPKSINVSAYGELVYNGEKYDDLSIIPMTSDEFADESHSILGANYEELAEYAGNDKAYNFVGLWDFAITNGDKLKVVDGFGNDISANYTVSASSMGSILILSKNFSITPIELGKVYDGKTIATDADVEALIPYEGFYTAYSDGLIDGHKITATTKYAYAGESAVLNVGRYVGAYQVTDVKVFAGDIDVTENYVLDPENPNGNIYVEKRLLNYVFKQDNVVFTYNGTYQSTEKPVLTPDENSYFPAEGDTVVEITVKEFLVAGEDMRNEIIAINIVNALGEDVSANYKWITEDAYVTVKPVEITITAENKTFDKTEFDNSFHSWPYYTVVDEYGNSTAVLSGNVEVVFDIVSAYDKIYASGFPEVRAGTVSNTCTNVVIKNYLTGEAVDVSNSYVVNIVSGSKLVMPVLARENYTKLVIKDDKLTAEQQNTTIIGVSAEYGGDVFLRTKSYGNYDGVNAWQVAPEYGELIDGKYSANYLASYAISNGSYNIYPYLMLLTLNLNGGYNQYAMPTYVNPATQPDSQIQTSDVAYSGVDVESGGIGNSYQLHTYYYDYLSDGVSGLALNDEALEQFELDYRTFVYSNYLSVEGLSEDTENMMMSLLGEYGIIGREYDDQRDMIKDVMNMLHNIAVYSQDYPRELDGEIDVMRAFLSEKYREGTDQHFASATTLMLRLLGIPARYTVGAKADVRSNFNSTRLTLTDEASWVEIYIDGVGWVAIDPMDVENPNVLVFKPVDKVVKYGNDVTLTASDIEGANDYTKKYMAKMALQNYIFSAKFKVNVDGGYSEIDSISIIKAGQAPQIVYSGTAADGFDNWGSHAIKVRNGLITETEKTIITVKFISVKKTYDGNMFKFTANDYTVSGNLYGCEFELIGTDQIMLAGVGSITQKDIARACSFTVKLDGEDVTDKYEVNYVCAGVYIFEREITLTAASGTHEYDGNVFNLNDCNVSSGSLATGHRVEVVCAGKITDVGSTVNTISAYKILDANDKDVTDNYNVTCNTGTLTVTPGAAA